MPDWWSVGIVIYQLMNKQSPFEKFDTTPYKAQGLGGKEYDDAVAKEHNRRILEHEWTFREQYEQHYSD